jgi:enoyl-CoA hydratase/carnithine racemase
MAVGTITQLNAVDIQPLVARLAAASGRSTIDVAMMDELAQALAGIEAGRCLHGDIERRGEAFSVGVDVAALRTKWKVCWPSFMP